LTVGDVVGILGWIRKPRILVVKMCCSSNLFCDVRLDNSD
jgi:hypothetical protein